ncbi:Threonine aldolase [Mortierella hygrophila]|uniref:Threonine aldolase n=1 Tax=Mortierella hygrophila TaxID=979708 RepID=A0A9P6FHP1_9FUNG|nr:Threonine aldolase [Mortierella hygrophila]
MVGSKSVNPLPYSDFRSDTATAPTPEMFAAMMKTSLGDDVYNEDDSVKKLERYVATLCGHEAALFCSSGTMTNQLAHRVHLSNPPQSAMVDIRSHVFNYEAGGISFHSQAAVYPIMPSNNKYLTAEDVASRLVLDVDVHYAPTRSISLENTLNGTIMPIEEMERIRILTKEHNIKLHLDGARLWHASIATGISMKEYCSHFDTVSLCLSKGIGAPIGSILVGSEVTIKKARHFRLLFGGGWRQAGLLAEAALWGIKNNWPTMEDTHRRAKWLERVFLQVGCQITNPVDTNMVWVDTTNAGFSVDDLIVELAKEGIKISGSGCQARVVLHYQISDEAVQLFIEVLRKLAHSPRMKVNVDLIKTSMREQPHSVFDDEHNDRMTPSSPPLSPDSPILGQIQTLSKNQSSEANHQSGKPSDSDAEDEVLPRSSIQSGPDMKQCLFKESNEPTLDTTEPFQPSSRRSAPRLMSAYYEPELMKAKVREAEQVYGMRKSFSEHLSEDDESHSEDDQVPSSRMIRTTQSLDLQEIEARAVVEQLAAAVDSQRPQTAVSTCEKKKVKKIQYRLAHNTASKAFKRASVRIVRWGSFLNREA